MKRVLIIAGGTGGHIFPALAVADQLSAQNIEVHWLGARYGLEAKLVPDKYRLKLMTMKGVRRSGLFAKLLMPWRMLRAVIKSYRMIRAIKPDVVLAMGGYVSAPGGVAAWLYRVPLVIHEQNAKAGLTNRLLVKFARVKLQAFSSAFKDAATIGNPVRSDLLLAKEPKARYDIANKNLRILIVGGSQGASAINQCLLQVWRQFSKTASLSIWHQTGERDFEQINAAYREIPISAKVEPFISDMASAYTWADLVICRAGAMTVSEIAGVGVASILIPYPFAVDNHQFYNAQYLSSQQAALLFPQKELSAEKMVRQLESFITDKHSLLTMAEAAKKLAHWDAAEKLAKACVNCMTG